MPKVSIIMPNKNNARWLPRSIGSVLNQSYNNWELIIVDDNSTDKSVDVIREFIDKDSRIDCICNPDVSYPLTKNLGFEHSSGKYVVFLDSDDWLGEMFLGRGVENIRDVDGYASSFAVWFGNETYHTFKFEKGVFSYVNALKLRFRFRNGNTLLRRKIIEKYNIRFPEFKYSEDMYFYIQYLVWSDRIFVDDYIGFFVNKNQSNTLSSRGLDGYFDTIKVCETLFGILSKYGKFDEINLIRNNDMIFSILNYLDAMPRKYKLRYSVENFLGILKFLSRSECYMKKWAFATAFDLIIPIKWFLRRVIR